MSIKQYLDKDNIIDMLTRYELYYEIGLANYIYETIQDIDEAYVKLEELGLVVETDVALSNIIEMMLHYSFREDFEDVLEFYIRSRALLHALKDFVNSDKELMHKDSYVEQKTQEILNDQYFTPSMKAQLESEYMDVVEKYEILVTDEVVQALHHNLGNV